MNYIKTNFLSLVSAMIIFAGVPVVLAWTAPKATPPGDNAPAPINVSLTEQSKTGKLGLGSLAVFGQTQMDRTGTYTLSGAARSSLTLGVNGKIGANEFCDENGEHCVSMATLSQITNINNNSTTTIDGGEDGDFIFINPENRSNTPLACAAGKNYKISKFKSKHTERGYSYKPIVQLESGTWSINGAINFAGEGVAYKFRVARSVSGPVEVSTGAAKKKGYYIINMATKVVTIPEGETGTLEMGGSIGVEITADITAWCNNRGSTLNVTTSPASPTRLGNLTINWTGDNIPVEAPVALKILDAANKAVYTFAGDKSGNKSKTIPLTDLAKYTKNGVYKVTATVVAGGSPITATSPTFTIVDPTATFSLAGAAKLVPTNTSAGATTKLTATFPMSVAVTGGTLTKPVAGDFVVKFKNNTSGIVTDDTSAVIKQTFPATLTGGTYSFTIESTYTTSAAKRGSYTAEIVSIKSKFGTIPAVTEAFTTLKTEVATAQ